MSFGRGVTRLFTLNVVLPVSVSKIGTRLVCQLFVYTPLALFLAIVSQPQVVRLSESNPPYFLVCNSCRWNDLEIRLELLLSIGWGWDPALSTRMEIRWLRPNIFKCVVFLWLCLYCPLGRFYLIFCVFCVVSVWCEIWCFLRRPNVCICSVWDRCDKACLAATWYSFKKAPRWQ